MVFSSGGLVNLEVEIADSHRHALAHLACILLGKRMHHNGFWNTLQCATTCSTTTITRIF